jgi:hypothetical protein
LQEVKLAGKGIRKDELNEGYCYLCWYEPEVQHDVASILRPYPTFEKLKALGLQCVAMVVPTLPNEMGSRTLKLLLVLLGFLLIDSTCETTVGLVFILF